MQLEEEGLRNRVALGWVLSLLLIVIMLLYMTMDSILQFNDFQSLRIDPGRHGLIDLVYILGLYGLMPVYVHLVHGLRLRIFRWIGVGAAALGFVYFLLHHLSHWQRGERPGFTSHVVDLVFHLVALWLIVNSVKWAKAPSAGAHEQD